MFRVERARGPAWYCKYRLPDGRQVQKKLGPACTDRGRPPAGYFTKRLAEARLRELLDDARRGTLPGLVQTCATFADAAAEYLRYIEHDRGRKPSTVRGYRSAITAHLLPVFGSLPVENVTTEVIERWIAGFGGSPRSRNELLIQLHGILERAEKVYGLRLNAAREVEKFAAKVSGDIEVFSPEEVWALVRVAGSELDAALYLTAAFTGLRMGELLVLRWRDVDLAGSTIRLSASYYLGQLTTPNPARYARLGSRPTWRPRSRGSASVSTGPAMMTSCSRAKPAATRTARRCVAATSWLSPPGAFAPCASTISGIPSARG